MKFGIWVFFETLFRNLSQYVTNLMHKICFTVSFISCLYMFRAHVLIIRRSKLHYTYRCDDTRGRVMQFWPPDDEHMCSKHVEAWNKTYCETKFCASNWLHTEINILRCTVRKTSKSVYKVQISLISDTHNGYFTWRPTYTSNYSS